MESDDPLDSSMPRIAMSPVIDTSFEAPVLSDWMLRLYAPSFPRT